MEKFLSASVLSVLVVAGLGAQSGAKFEVASVKAIAPRTTDAGGGARGTGGGGGCVESVKLDLGRSDIECASLLTLISFAYRIPPARITGPDWMTGRGVIKFDISAKLPPGSSRDQFPEMLRDLLADRFHLAVHHGVPEQAIYALVVAKGGSKLKQAAPEAAAAVADSSASEITLIGGIQTRTARTPNAKGGGDSTTMTNPRMGTVHETEGPDLTQRWEAPSTTLGGLADLLDRVGPWDPPVIDMTGLNGRYQVVLEVSLKADPAARESAQLERQEVFVSAFNDGLRKLGLQLVRRKGLVDTVFVDRLEKMPTGN